MIVWSNGKSYDTADGSEQPHPGSVRPRVDQDAADANRLADDGAPPKRNGSREQRRTTLLHQLSIGKASWSVLSLGRVADLVRRFRRELPLRQQTARTASETKNADETQRREAAVTQANDERYRNAWENT